MFISVFCFSYGHFSFSQTVDRVVAIVNSEIILESDVDRLKSTIDKGNMINDLLLFGATPNQVAKDRKALINYLVSDKILESEIKRLKLSITSDRVEQEIQDLAKKNGMSRNDLLKAVQSQGMSPAEYQKFVKQKIEQQSLIEAEVTSRIRISDDEVTAEFLRKNESAKANIYEFEVSQILFNSKKKGGLTAARARAEAALSRLNKGESFELVAEQTSEDRGFSNGGALGSFKINELTKEFAKAIEPLEVNQFSNIVETSRGVHILKLTGKKSTPNPVLMAAREKIRSQMLEKSFEGHFKNWLETRLEQSFVRFN